MQGWPRSTFQSWTSRTARLHIMPNISASGEGLILQPWFDKFFPKFFSRSIVFKHSQNVQGGKFCPPPIFSELGPIFIWSVLLWVPFLMHHKFFDIQWWFDEFFFSFSFQINSVQALAKCTGWQVLSSSTYHLGCGPVEPLGNATGCLLANSVGDKFIAVRIYYFNFLTFSDPT